MIKFSIIIPIYNEEDGVDKVIREIKETVNKNFEIIAVNDGSTDNTASVLGKIKNITLINHERNKGYGAALKSGIKQAQGKYIIITDADGTYPIKMIKKLVKDADSYDMIVGARIGPNSHIPVIRKPAKWCINQLANYLTETKIPDLNSGLRLFRKDLCEQFFRFYPNGFSFTTTITLAFLTNNYCVKYLPINYYKRKGKSKIRPIKDTLNFVQLILRTVLYFNPLKVFAPISLALLIITALILGYGYFFTSKIFDITTVILLFFSAQILAIGMLADLIVKSTQHHGVK